MSDINHSPSPKTVTKVTKTVTKTITKTVPISHNLTFDINRKTGVIGDFDTRSGLYSITGFQVLPYIGTRHRGIIEKLEALSCYIGADRVIVPTIVNHPDPYHQFNSTVNKINDIEMKMVMFINNPDIFSKLGIDIIDFKTVPDTFNLFANIAEFQDIDLWNQLCHQLIAAIPTAIRIDTKGHLFHIGYQRHDLNHQLIYLGYHQFTAGIKQSPVNIELIQLDKIDYASINIYLNVIEKLVRFISVHGIVDREGIDEDVIKSMITNITFIVKTAINGSNGLSRI